MPSSCSSFCVQTIASRLETMIFRSSTERSMIGGMKPSSRDRSPWTSSPCIGSGARKLGPRSGNELALHRLGGDDLGLRLGLLEAPPDAHQGAAGPQPGHERRDVIEL